MGFHPSGNLVLISGFDPQQIPPKRTETSLKSLRKGHISAVGEGQRETSGRIWAPGGFNSPQERDHRFEATVQTIVDLLILSLLTTQNYQAG